MDSTLIPPRKEWDQGDIVSRAYFSATDHHHPAILLTPACDIAQEKVTLWTLVALFPEIEVARVLLEPELQSYIKAPGGISGKQTLALKKKLQQLIEHRFPRYHWLPLKHDGHQGYVADFTHITSLPAAEVQSKSTRVASVVSSWREQVPARYASYMGRVGTEDYEPSIIDSHLTALVTAVVASHT